MYFDNHTNFPNATLNPRLLWEYNFEEVDFLKMRNIIIQRVVERGWPNDWYFILNTYGMEGVKSAILEIPYLNDKDMNFVSILFNIPLTSMKCYEKKQSQPQRWTS